VVGLTVSRVERVVLCRRSLPVAVVLAVVLPFLLLLLGPSTLLRNEKGRGSR
jgi:hypothetical protein